MLQRIFRSILTFLRRVWGDQPVGWATLLPGLLLTAVLLALPTGYEGAVIYQGTEKVRATVLATNEDTVISTGLIQTGEQVCTLRIEEGLFKGREVQGANLLSGSLSQDKIFAPGDSAFVVVSYQGDTVTSVTMIDHYRITWEWVLALFFALLLILFAGPGGVRALLSFVITVLAIWKVMIPTCLKGGNPLLMGLLLVALLTVVIIVFVYGYDRRSLVAVLGSMLGTVTACGLLYAGYQNLDLTNIFMASIFIGAAGAMMDLAVDITSGVSEVIRKKPGIGAWEAVGSGMRIGQAAMGTMTTTLLLAYSGGCMAQLMVFMAQGTPILNILNYKYVASEILQTLVGSFGLVTVAPFTAVVAGLLLTRAPQKETSPAEPAA